MKAVPRVLSVLAALWWAGVVHAWPVTVSAGQRVTFNFDLTPIVPASAYRSVRIYFEQDDVDAADVGSFNVFDDVDGFGSTVATQTSLFHPPYSLYFANTLSDGIFSLVVAMSAGSIEVEPWAEGWNGRFASRPIAGTLSTVPEPATFGLAAMALAGLVVTRRRSLKS